MEKKLSIGFAHHNDFSGAWFTIQDIRKELLFNGRKDLLDQIEFVVVFAEVALIHVHRILIGEGIFVDDPLAGGNLLGINLSLAL